MKIKVNEKEIECPDGCNITSLLELIEVDATKGIAIAMQNTVIPRTQWKETILKENDQLVVISATRGG